MTDDEETETDQETNTAGLRVAHVLAEGARTLGGVATGPVGGGILMSSDPQPENIAMNIEDGRLFDLLDVAARLIDDGRIAPSATMKCVYRDVIHEAIRRLRASSDPGPRLRALIAAIGRLERFGFAAGVRAPDTHIPTKRWVDADELETLLQGLGEPDRSVAIDPVVGSGTEDATRDGKS